MLDKDSRWDMENLAEVLREHLELEIVEGILIVRFHYETIATLPLPKK